MDEITATARRRAFTLVEMMVVVAIIALLLAALLPAFGTVKNKAKIAQTSAQFKALDTGINAFRAEAALGGALPPSSSDDQHRQTIADPQGEASNTKVRIAGAHLLVHAMIGADGLGTPGFRDISSPANGKWSDDTHKKFDAGAGKSGVYAIDPTTGKEKFPRYGGAGYVDEKMAKDARTLRELADKGVIVTDLDSLSSPAIAVDQRVFTDAWDHPILYYKGNPSALYMTGASGKPPGIYWQEDNGIITGSDSSIQGDPGLDFGQGTEGTCNSGKCYHHIAVAAGPEPSLAQSANWLETFRADANYDYSFARFIIDGSVKARPTAVQKDSYLLISAGPDARYGTDDDVLNWTRKTD